MTQSGESNSLRPYGLQITMDGKLVLTDTQAASVYRLEELLATHALNWEREQVRRGRSPAKQALTVEVWYRR